MQFKDWLKLDEAGPGGATGRIKNRPTAQQVVNRSRLWGPAAHFGPTTHYNPEDEESPLKQKFYQHIVAPVGQGIGGAIGSELQKRGLNVQAMATVEPFPTSPATQGFKIVLPLQLPPEEWGIKKPTYDNVSPRLASQKVVQDGNFQKLYPDDKNPAEVSAAMDMSKAQLAVDFTKILGHIAAVNALKTLEQKEKKFILQGLDWKNPTIKTEQQGKNLIVVMEFKKIDPDYQYAGHPNDEQNNDNEEIGILLPQIRDANGYLHKVIRTKDASYWPFVYDDGNVYYHDMAKKGNFELVNNKLIPAKDLINVKPQRKASINYR